MSLLPTFEMGYPKKDFVPKITPNCWPKKPPMYPIPQEITPVTRPIAAPEIPALNILSGLILLKFQSTDLPCSIKLLPASKSTVVPTLIKTELDKDIIADVAAAADKANPIPVAIKATAAIAITPTNNHFSQRGRFPFSSSVFIGLLKQ